MHNALDAVHVADQWRRGQDDLEAARELVQYRQALYETKTLQMHGKNRRMLKGYRADNSKGDSPKPAETYSPDPATRYNLKAETLGSVRASAGSASSPSRRGSVTSRRHSAEGH